MAWQVWRQEKTDESGGLAVIALTPAGKNLADRLAGAWNETGGAACVYHPTSSLSGLVRSLWNRHQSFVFIMAVGIVVRVIAPLIRDKWCDPAVVVVDEGGKFAVSLLGGHWAGANSLARRVAALLGAVPVVTTATDVQGTAAVDLLARQWSFLPVPREGVKGVSRALLEGKRLVFYTEWQLPGIEEIPSVGAVRPFPGEPGDVPEEPGEVPVFVTSRMVCSFAPDACTLCPPSLAAGIGCRRGGPAGEIEAALTEAFRRAGRHLESLKVIATHRAKADEEGLREAARTLGVPLVFFTSQSLRGVLERYPGLREGDFVRRQMGVGNVCETAALASVPEGTLVFPKLRLGRVTVALAEAGLLLSASGREMRRI